MRIYVADTGINCVVDFCGRLVNGYDAPGHGFYDSYSATINGHATEVVGLAAGTTWGVAKTATIVNVKVFGPYDDYAQGVSTAMAGLNWIITDHQNHPNVPAVVNMRLAYYQDGTGAGPVDLSQFDQAVINIIDSGVAVVVGAGNAVYDLYSGQYSPHTARPATTLARGTPAAWAN